MTLAGIAQAIAGGAIAVVGSHLAMKKGKLWERGAGAAIVLIGAGAAYSGLTGNPINIGPVSLSGVAGNGLGYYGPPRADVARMFRPWG